MSIPPALAPFIPVIIIAVILLILAKWGGARLWELLLTLLLGVALSGTVLGPEISLLLSQVSGGHLR